MTGITILSGFLNVPYVANFDITLSGINYVTKVTIKNNFPSDSGLILQSGTITSYSTNLNETVNTSGGSIIQYWSGKNLKIPFSVTGTPLKTNPGTATIVVEYSTGPIDTQWERWNSSTYSVRLRQVTISPISITTHFLPYGTTNISYTQQLQVVGTQPITWSIASGSLPPGLSLDPNTGVISGTPLANQS